MEQPQRQWPLDRQPCANQTSHEVVIGPGEPGQHSQKIGTKAKKSCAGWDWAYYSKLLQIDAIAPALQYELF